MEKTTVYYTCCNQTDLRTSSDCQFANSKTLSELLGVFEAQFSHLKIRILILIAIYISYENVMQLEFSSVAHVK